MLLARQVVFSLIVRGSDRKLRLIESKRHLINQQRVAQAIPWHFHHQNRRWKSDYTNKWVRQLGIWEVVRKLWKASCLVFMTGSSAFIISVFRGEIYLFIRKVWETIFKSMTGDSRNSRSQWSLEVIEPASRWIIKTGIWLFSAAERVLNAELCDWQLWLIFAMQEKHFMILVAIELLINICSPLKLRTHCLFFTSSTKSSRPLWLKWLLIRSVFSQL